MEGGMDRERGGCVVDRRIDRWRDGSEIVMKYINLCNHFLELFCRKHTQSDRSLAEWPGGPALRNWLGGVLKACAEPTLKDLEEPLPY